jgi:hypothetical protein
MSNCSYAPNGQIASDHQFTTALRSKILTTCSIKAAAVESDNLTVNKELRVDELIDKYNVKFYGAVGDGVTDDTAAIQEALNTVDNVYVPEGTYLVSSSIYIPSNTYLHGTHESVIKRADAAGLFYMLIFVGDNSTIDTLRLDGNRANNPLSTLLSGHISFFNRENNQAINNILENSPGLDFHGNNTNYFRIINNKSSGRHGNAVFISGNGNNAFGIIRDNVWSGSGTTISIGVTNYVLIENNILDGVNKGLQFSLTVDTDGVDIITKNTGSEDWSDIGTNSVVSLDGGKEFFVTEVISATQLRVTGSGPLPVLVNTRAVIGLADGIGIQSSSSCIIQGNLVRGVATYGMGTSCAETENTSYNIFIGNQIVLCGKVGIYIGSDPGGVGIQTIGTHVIGNNLVSCGIGTTAIQNVDRCGIYVAAFATARTVQTSIIGNHIHGDGLGFGQADYGIGFSVNVDAGAVDLRSNSIFFCTFGTQILNDVKSITLSATWGSTATVTGIEEYGHDTVFTINATGVGHAIDPTITLVKVSTTTQEPQPFLFLRDATLTTAVNITYPFLSSAVSATSSLFRYTGTPDPNDVYRCCIKY